MFMGRRRPAGLYTDSTGTTEAALSLKLIRTARPLPLFHVTAAGGLDLSMQFVLHRQNAAQSAHLSL
jgi:hypothetical protein